MYFVKSLTVCFTVCCLNTLKMQEKLLNSVTDKDIFTFNYESNRGKTGRMRLPKAESWVIK